MNRAATPEFPDSALAELQAFRLRHPAVDQIYALMSDANGVLRGKRLAADELDGLYAGGRPIASSLIWLDITGKDIEGYELVWEDGDSDRLCRPVPGSLTPAPWLGERYGQVLLSMYEADGRPTPTDPRQVLAGVLERYTARGLVPVVAAELEFYLVDKARDGRGRVRPPEFPGGGRPTDKRGYEVADLEAFQELLTAIQDTARALGIPAETTIAEYGPAQFEMTLRHQADALRAMDQAVLFKRLVKGLADRHGCQATFMAKPYAGESGSGLHVHMSLNDTEGRNLFASEEPAGTPLLRQAIAGLKTHLPDCLLLFAPHGNSYRRLKPGCYAPVNCAWGVNNRTVSLRVPSGPGASRRLEHRVAGADANPYLVMAAILAAALDGIDGRREPGPPAEGNAYKSARPGELPLHWLDAIARFEASAFVREAFPGEFRELFLATKKAEAAEFLGEVSALDYDWYLRSV